MRLSVHVTPKAARDEVAGWRGQELSVRVRAVPEGGKANDAVCRLLARALGLPAGGVTVVRGHSSRHKQVEFEAAPADVERVFGGPPPALF